MPQFTKRALIDSFIKLLNETSLDKITVKDIVDECGVNRNTFYYYFQDIYAMLDEIFRAEAEKVIKESELYKSWKDGFIKSAVFALENRKAIYHIYNSINREQLEKYLYNITESLMLKFVNLQAEGMNVSEEDKKFIADIYKYALVGMVLDWISRGMTDDTEIFIDKMEKIFDGSVKNALKNSEANSNCEVKSQIC